MVYVHLTIKELDDVRKVHVILQDDVSVSLDQRKSNEEHKVFGGRVLGRPDGFPQGEHIVVHHLCREKGTTKVRQVAFLFYFLLHSPSRLTSLKVQQEPAIAEVEVSVVSVLLHQLKQLRV